MISTIIFAATKMLVTLGLMLFVASLARANEMPHEPTSANQHNGIIRLPGGSNEFRIPIMVPLHKPLNSKLSDSDCSQEPNPAAINDLRAALWAIDKINSDANFVAGIKFGAVVIDTCSSPSVATQRLAHYLAEESHNIIGHISMNQVDPEAGRVIDELSTALNMSAAGLLNYDDDKLSSQQPHAVVEPSANHQDPIGSDPQSNTGTVDSSVTATERANFRRTWGIVTSLVSAMGVLMVLVCSVYFLMVFRVNVGTTILGYFILLGLLLLYSVNFLFVIGPSMPVCWLRRLGMSVAYSTILAGMLVKVMNTWRLMSYRKVTPSGAGDLKLTSPFGLLFISGGLVTVQIFVTGTWLVLFPPRPGQYDGIWRCSQPSPSDFLIETESVVSLLYIVLLILITLFFAVLCWRCFDNNQEPRYIAGCCLSMAGAWLLWSLYSYRVNKHRFSSSRDLSIICANLATATLIMVCLYLRKLYLYNKLKRKDKHLTARLQRSSGAFPGNFYGAFHNGGPRMWDQLSYNSNSVPSTATSSIRGSISSIKSSDKKRSKSSSRPPFEEDIMDDGTASCGSAASSVQVQGHDLYPMEVYDGGSQFQPSSLFQTANSKHVYPEDSSFIR